MTFTNPGRKYDVLAEIADERSRQDEKWGEQNHPDGTGWGGQFLGASFNSLARYTRQACQEAGEGGRDQWSLILLEEVFEAMAEEPGSQALRTELVQVAAVATAWIEAIDRRAAE